LAFYRAASGKFGAMSWSVGSTCHPSRAFPSEGTQNSTGAVVAASIKRILAQVLQTSFVEPSEASEGRVQRILLTDEQLWRAIAENTNEMSALVDQQFELTAANGALDVGRRANLKQLNAQRINTLQRQYQTFTAELRRRYS
jgi:hypothetical protein